MGEIHKAGLDGLKLEGAAKEHGPVIAFFFGFWFTAFVAFSQKDDKLKSALIKVAVCQWLTTPFCAIGWIWALCFAIAAKKQS
jgi:hypothetical protein